MLLSWLFILPAKAEIAVIAHPSVTLKQVTPTFLSRVYAMQIKTWPSGNPIKVYSFSSQTPEFNTFVTSKAKLQPHQLNRHWKRLLFTGTSRVPVITNSTNEMIEKVRNNPGAIGYVDISSLPTDLKVLTVEEQK